MNEDSIMKALGESIDNARAAIATANQDRTAKINRLQRRHPGTRRQRSSHGAGRYSVQFFCKTTGKLVANYYL
jgi:hypothetical protein